MGNAVYIRLRGNVTGPFDDAGLKTMAARGLFSRLHEISTDGLNWESATSRPELFGSTAAYTGPVAAGPVAAGPVAREAAGTDSYGPSAAADTEPNSAEEAYAEPADDDNWYIEMGSEGQGPFAFERVEEMFNQGQITGETLLWHDSLSTWTAARDLLESAKFDDESTAPFVLDEPPPGEQELSLLAVASVGFGVLWILGVGSLAAMVLGGLALQQIENSHGEIKGRNFAMAGLLIGMIGALATTVLFCAYRAKLL